MNVMLITGGQKIIFLYSGRSGGTRGNGALSDGGQGEPTPASHEFPVPERRRQQVLMLVVLEAVG